MRLSIKLIFLLVTLFAFLELSNAVPKGRGGGGGRGGKFKSPTKSLYIIMSVRLWNLAKIRVFKVDCLVLTLFLKPNLSSVAQIEWKKQPYIFFLLSVQK